MSPRRKPDMPTRPAALSAGSAAANDEMQSIVIGLDEAFRQSEQVWGVGRLVRLVSDATRSSYQRGMAAYNDAITSGDLAALRAIAPKMRVALDYMAREATEAGQAPLAPAVWECRLDDGRVLAVVRSAAEAHAVAREGRHLEVWTLEEIARVLPRMVSDIKHAFPGALVERVTRHEEGYAQDWATAPEWLDVVGAE